MISPTIIPNLRANILHKVLTLEQNEMTIINTHV